MPDSRGRHKWSETAKPSTALDVRAVYREHSDFVWRCLSRLGVHADDLTDMTQEVFLIVHRQANTWRSDVRVTTWLFGICRKVAAGYRRRAHRRYEEVVADAPEPTYSDTPQPDETLAVRQARARLDAILSTLKPEQRAVFVMFEIEELSCETIAEQTGIPLGTVFSRLRSARQAFTKALKRWQAQEARKSV
ncbi:MAG: sigma-70 family RNA polymerase sigma factor [Myxococcota bacterium]